MLSSRGFTLMEVLVALALIGLLFITVGAVLERQMGTQRQLEENLAAAQLGWNLMETFHLEGNPLMPDLLEGEGDMAGWVFPWSRKIQLLSEETAAQGRWYQVRIRVGSADRPLYEERWSWPSP